MSKAEPMTPEQVEELRRKIELYDRTTRELFTLHTNGPPLHKQYDSMVRRHETAQDLVMVFCAANRHAILASLDLLAGGVEGTGVSTGAIYHPEGGVGIHVRMTKDALDRYIAAKPGKFPRLLIIPPTQEPRRCTLSR